MIWILLISMVILLFVTLVLFDFEFVHPSVLLCSVFLVSIICCIYNIESWSVDLSIETYSVIVLMTLEFIFIGLIIKPNSSKNRVSKSSITQVYISIPKPVYIIVIIIDIVCLLVYIDGVQSIAYRYGTYDYLGDMLNAYRMHTSYSLDDSLPFFTSQCKKYCEACAYIFIIISGFNIISGKAKVRESIMFLLPILIYIVAAFMNSGRLSILRLIAAGIFLWIFLSALKNGWGRISQLRQIAFIAIICILILVGFYLIRTLVGRVSSAHWDFLDYITMYAGGSIQLLDMYLLNPAPSSDIPGIETFYGLIANLSKYGFVDFGTIPISHLEFRYNGSSFIGNVYTAYRRWIFDFGLVGMAVLQAIISIFFHGIYYRLKRTDNLSGSFLFVFYTYCVPLLMLQSIDSVFYTCIFNVGFVVNILFMYILYRILIRKNIKYITKTYIRD